MPVPAELDAGSHPVLTALLWGAAALYAAAFLAAAVRPAWGRPVLAMGALLHLSGTVGRGLAIEFFPLTNKMESFSAAALGVVQLHDVHDADSNRLVEELARASGTVRGMIGGQVHDLEGEHLAPTAELLEKIHRAKTGALLRSSVRLGAMHAGASPEELDALSRFGEHAGLAFQIVDDILDVEGASAELGKTAGKDAAAGKLTYPALFGLEKSRALAAGCIDRALAVLERAGLSGRLPEIARWVSERTN